MKKYKHLFFDMDMTIAPARLPILPEMFELLSSLSEDIIIVSGQTAEKIAWQTNNLPAFYLGNNGNHAFSPTGKELWKNPNLNNKEREEILAHTDKLKVLLDFIPNEDWSPVEDRGSQITFSPIGNTAPVELKKQFDPDRSKRMTMMKKVPFISETIMMKIGGSTSFDYFPIKGHKGSNVAKLIKLMNWNKDDCVYYGDGLYQGGNDEVVIGVIDTIPVEDHIDTYTKLNAQFNKHT
ncbi:HAD-IIB family hydrolase [Candidatus Kaiserbacteria bacterium]|nr:HAD-IIB family hydrolase [Candidatus Kaiserbacteria bacterium]